MTLAAGALVRHNQLRTVNVWSRPLGTDTAPEGFNDRLTLVHRMEAWDVALVVGMHAGYALIAVDGKLGWLNEGYLTNVE